MQPDRSLPPREALAMQMARAMAVAFWRGRLQKLGDESDREFEAAIARNADADSHRWMPAAEMQLSFCLDYCKPLEWK